MKTALSVLGILVLVAVAAGAGFVYGTVRSGGQLTLPFVGTIGSAQPGPGQFMRGQFDLSRLSPEQAQQFQQMWQARGTPGAERRFGQGEGAPMAGIAGTIEAIENGVLTVRTQNGTITVKTTETTLIEKMMSVNVEDLQVGERVVVSGSRNADGSTTARSIRVMATPRQP